MSEASLGQFLADLADIKSGAENSLDPVRLAYFDSLATRLNEPRHSMNQVLIESACNSLQQYRDDFSVQKGLAKRNLDWMVLYFPNQSAAAEDSFKRGEFKTLEKLKTRLEQDNLKLTNTNERSNSLRDLIDGINQEPLESKQNTASSSFDDVLMLQEVTVIERAQLRRSDQSIVLKDGSGEQLELQSMKVFRESLKYFDVDQLINRAINECPENPGPHNPQMLAVKALMQMRDLSPQYLRRFAGYVEAMLWAEKNAAKLTNIKPLA